MGEEIIPEIAVRDDESRDLVITALVNHLHMGAARTLLSGDILGLIENAGRIVRLLDTLCAEHVTPSDQEIADRLRDFGRQFGTDNG